MLEDQRIKNHPRYSAYAQMRIREQKLLCEGEQLRKEFSPEILENEDFKEPCKRFASARKKLDYLEQILRENTA